MYMFAFLSLQSRNLKQEVNRAEKLYSKVSTQVKLSILLRPRLAAAAWSSASFLLGFGNPKDRLTRPVPLGRRSPAQLSP